MATCVKVRRYEPMNVVDLGTIISLLSMYNQHTPFDALAALGSALDQVRATWMRHCLFL